MSLGNLDSCRFSNSFPLVDDDIFFRRAVSILAIACVRSSLVCVATIPQSVLPTATIPELREPLHHRKVPATGGDDNEIHDDEHDVVAPAIRA